MRLAERDNDDCTRLLGTLWFRDGLGPQTIQGRQPQRRFAGSTCFGRSTLRPYKNSARATSFLLYTVIMAPTSERAGTAFILSSK